MIFWEDEAIILSYQDYSESSIILKVFTQNLGIRKGFIRGAKKKKKTIFLKVETYYPLLIKQELKIC